MNSSIALFVVFILLIKLLKLVKLKVVQCSVVKPPARDLVELFQSYKSISSLIGLFKLGLLPFP